MIPGISDCVMPDLDALAARVRELKSRGRSIALANGGFDLFHVGHARYLRAAAEIADILVVAVNSDQSLRRLKGSGRPVLPLEERVAILCSIEGVDLVFAFDEPTVSTVLLALEPDFHCKGGDYSVESVPEADVVRSFGGKVVIVGGDKVQSTSWLLRKSGASGA